MILLTGFEKFDEFSFNTSELLVRDFPKKINSFLFIKKILPVSWKKCILEYSKILDKLKAHPRLVILTGIYSGKKILIERYGWNLRFGIDNYYQFRIGPIKFSKIIRLKTNLNISQLIKHLKEKNKILISSYPGLYICNFLYFWALYLAKKAYPVVFIHLPTKIEIDIIKERFHNLVLLILDSLK